MVHTSQSIKKLNRLVNLDIKHLSVYTNKISLNILKTELVIFNQKRQKNTIRKRKDSILHQVLNVQGPQLIKLELAAAKQNRASTLLFKIRNYINQKKLKSIYYAILYWLKILM